MTNHPAILARLALVVSLGAGLAGTLAAGMPTGMAPSTGPMSDGTSTEATYVLPVDETYGLSACLGSGECGTDAARAFCQAKGLPSTGSYARATDDSSYEVGCRA